MFVNARRLAVRILSFNMSSSDDFGRACRDLSARGCSSDQGGGSDPLKMACKRRSSTPFIHGMTRSEAMDLQFPPPSALKDATAARAAPALAWAS
jgi:hypothetical protein